MEGKVLLTGGSGFVGSHVLVELLAGDYRCIVIDNLCNSSEECLRRVEKITGKSVEFVECDLLDFDKVCDVFSRNKIFAVLHFAALKAVGESVKKPLLYYDNNVRGTLNLLKAMAQYDVKRIIFSSSATVYGEPKYLPIDEKHEVGKCCNPYGMSKFFIETIISDQMSSVDGSYIHLRYFNPIGAHESGLIGEVPKGTPNNLVPYVAMVADGALPYLSVFGNDYDTPDGTGVRDYIHVVDLAKGHCAALKLIENSQTAVQKVYNLGTGRGCSVLEVVKAYEKVSRCNIPLKMAPRRAGDASSVFANIDLAKNELKWTAVYGIEKMCEDSWRWRSNNPNGYE